MHEPLRLDRPQKLFAVLTGLFLTALVVAEATASKLFYLSELPFTYRLFGWSTDKAVLTVGVIAFPVTFIVTDLLNEYYGKKGVRFVTLLGAAMIAFEFVLLRIGMAVPEAQGSPVPDAAFDTVFGASGRIIFASLVAFLLGQLLDITLFHWLRARTRGRHLWLRATGSTFGSQFIDTFLVLLIAFYGPDFPIGAVVAVTLFNYAYKFGIAVLITPLIYAGHWMMDRYLGRHTEIGPPVDTPIPSAG
jgi:queuosine precursor transporter